MVIPSQLTLAIEIGAVLTSALSAMLVASRRGLDVVGTCTLALVAAFGGGTLRDLLVDRRPFFWDARWEYVPLIIGLAVAYVYSVKFNRVAREMSRHIVLVDAFGLALFSLTGLAYAREASMSPFVAVLIGVLAGTGGAVMRDVLVNETPAIFLPGELYAVASFVGCWAAVGAGMVIEDATGAATIGFVVIVALRLMSNRLGTRLPPPLWAQPPEKPPAD
jgi:uncharacterized membrane protein YeiH